jgi:hypothetical protein
MSLKTQTAHMKNLAELLGRDLGHIFGERESGPNGAKAQFLCAARAFLSGLRKDLGFAAWKIHTNKAGAAVSGEVALRGLWEKGNGLHMAISQDLTHGYALRFGPIKDIGDFKSGFAARLSIDTLRRANYAQLIIDLLAFRGDSHGRTAA